MECLLCITQFHQNSFSVCYAGDIQLTGTGSSVSKGNVELCILNHFNAICGNVWSSKDAKVVCRQLGFNSSKLLHKFHMRIILHCLGVECVLQNDRLRSERFSILLFIGIAATMSQFGAATTDYMWTERAGRCIGTEATLYSCHAYSVTVSCTSANPAAVICSSPCKDEKYDPSHGTLMVIGHNCMILDYFFDQLVFLFKRINKSA